MIFFILSSISIVASIVSLYAADRAAQLCGKRIWNIFGRQGGVVLAIATIFLLSPIIPSATAGFSSTLSRTETFANKLQLDDEEPGLRYLDEEKTKGECRYGVCRQHLPKGFLYVLMLCGLIGFFGAIGLCRLTGILR